MSNEDQNNGKNNTIGTYAVFIPLLVLCMINSRNVLSTYECNEDENNGKNNMYSGKNDAICALLESPLDDVILFVA